MTLPSQSTPGPDHSTPEYDVVDEKAVEPKTKAAPAGAAAGAIVSAFLVWAADQLWWNGADVEPSVPLPVIGIIGLVVTSAGSFLASYTARHVNR